MLTNKDLVWWDVDEKLVEVNNKKFRDIFKRFGGIDNYRGLDWGFLETIMSEMSFRLQIQIATQVSTIGIEETKLIGYDEDYLEWLKEEIMNSEFLRERITKYIVTNGSKNTFCCKEETE
jgi:hypothetical protein